MHVPLLCTCVCQSVHGCVSYVCKFVYVRVRVGVCGQLHKPVCMLYVETNAGGKEKVTVNLPTENKMLMWPPATEQRVVGDR